MRAITLQVSSLLIFLSSFTFLQAQQLSPAELNRQSEFKMSENYDFYLHKTGFKELPGMQLIGDFETDWTNYNNILKKESLKTTLSNQNTIRNAPANDASCSAFPLNINIVYGYTNIDATTQAGEVSPGLGTYGCEAQDGWCPGDIYPQVSVWYSFIAPASGFVTIVATGYDSQLALWSVADCSDFSTYSEVAANDDSGDMIYPGIHVWAAGIIAAPVTPGEEYYIQIDGWGGSTGSGLMIIRDDILPIINDDVCNAINLDMGTPTPYNNYLSTTQVNEVSPGPGSGPSCEAQDGWCTLDLNILRTVWFTFTAPNSGRVNIVASGFDNQLALWSVNNCNDFSTFTEVAANDDSGDQIWPGIHVWAAGIIEACVTPGNQYYIQLDGFGNGQGSGDIAVLDAGPSASIDAGTDATVYFGYDPMACTTLTASVSDIDGVNAGDISWSTGETGSSINVCPETTTTYTACYDDPNGCTYCDQVTVCAIDVRCYSEGGTQKVELCHKPGSNNENSLCIDAESVADHLAHGDHLGACGTISPCDIIPLVPENEETTTRNANEISLFPNPFSDEITISGITSENNLIQIEIYNINGQLKLRETRIATGENINIRTGALSKGLYVLRINSADYLHTEYMVKQ